MPITPPDRSAGQNADPKLPLAGRLTIAGLGALALALGAAGAAFAGSDDGDSAWVTIVDGDSSDTCRELRDSDGEGL